MSINFIIFNNPYKQKFTKIAQDPKSDLVQITVNFSLNGLFLKKYKF